MSWTPCGFLLEKDKILGLTVIVLGENVVRWVSRWLTQRNGWFSKTLILFNWCPLGFDPRGSCSQKFLSCYWRWTPGPVSDLADLDHTPQDTLLLPVWQCCTSPEALCFVLQMTCFAFLQVQILDFSTAVLKLFFWCRLSPKSQIEACRLDVTWICWKVRCIRFARLFVRFAPECCSGCAKFMVSAAWSLQQPFLSRWKVFWSYQYPAQIVDF